MSPNGHILHHPPNVGPQNGRVMHNYHDYSGEVDDIQVGNQRATLETTSRNHDLNDQTSEALVANNIAASLDPKARGGVNEQQVFPVR